MSEPSPEQLRRLGVFELGMTVRIPLSSLSDYLDLTDQHVARSLPTDPESNALRVVLASGRATGQHVSAEQEEQA